MNVSFVVVEAAIVADWLIAVAANGFRDSSGACAVDMVTWFGAWSEFRAWF
jgi:hypothetical protein